MSWIRDTGEDLVNLEMVTQLELVELECEDIEEEEFGVMASFVNGETIMLFTGESAACRARIDLIAAKLPMVKV